MTTFMLVHGAFHGAWCWYKAAALLEGRGHRVIAPDLPGHGRNAAARATYRAYVDCVAELLRQQTEPVALVGHSMGGAVITGAAEAAPEKVAKLIYLTAFLGPSGMSMSGELSSRAGGDSVIPASVCSNDALYPDCPPEDVMLAQLCLTPQALEPLTQPVVWTPERWGKIPRAYVGCVDDRVFAIAEQRKRADGAPGTEWMDLPSGHSPFFSMPERLVETLEALAR
jgi:pimeloyl-ACP methyl ester carboxylesterase